MMNSREKEKAMAREETSKHHVLQKLAARRRSAPSEIPISTRISKSLHNKIEAEARKQGVSMATLLREILEEVFLES
jgi:predicted HicB family RNase H-like nuclease